MIARATAAAVLAVLAGAVGTARAQPAAIRIGVEAGAEYDTNIHRLEVPEEDRDQIEGAPLVRAGARLRLQKRVAERHALELFGVAGGKLFFDEQAGASEDVAILAGNARYDVGLPSRRAIASARLAYYDAIGASSSLRNFSNADAELALILAGPDRHRVTGHLGYRRFDYKPDDDFDFGGPHFGLRYSTTLWSAEGDADDAATFDVAAAYRLEHRAYDGVAFTNGCPDGADPTPACFIPTALDRSDLFHSAIAELVFTGSFIWGVRYELQVADSNSVGQSLARHRLELSTTVETVWSVYATVRAAILYNAFLDPLLIARDVAAQSFVSIDDENRNSLVAHLSRDLTERWAVEARYALYTNEFATEELDFRRQTLYLGVVWTND